jgi:hypothetical protein
MAAIVHDEFEYMPISRQRRYQLRHKRDGLCALCPARAVMNVFCLKHWIPARERQRKALSCVHRNLGARSYQLENAAL